MSTDPPRTPGANPGSAKLNPSGGSDGAMPDPSAETVFGETGTGGTRLPFEPSLPAQDLLKDKLLLAAPRTSVDVKTGKKTPMLGGIPLLAKLGQGGMGAVYYGIHPRLLVEVAVKVLPFDLAERPELVERFQREARLAARVSSPHLVNVKDVNQESGLFFLVMDFVRGASAGQLLRERLASGLPGLSEREALSIAAAACEGLAAAHREGIVHRDIKPDNLLIPKRDGVFKLEETKLGDLGLARGDQDEGSLTRTNAFLGTPGYLAPEQANDPKHAGPSADVFSMGATIYAMLSGQAPFAGSSLMAVIQATAGLPHAPIRSIRPDVGDATAALINRCLAKDPAARFPDGTALRAALRGGLEQLAPSGSVEQPPTLRQPGIQPPPMTGPSMPFTLPLPQPAPSPAPYAPPPLSVSPQPPPPIFTPPPGPPAPPMGPPPQFIPPPTGPNPSYAPQPAGSNTGLIIALTVIALVLLGGIGGTLAWYFTKDRAGTPTNGNYKTTPAAPGAPPAPPPTTNGRFTLEYTSQYAGPDKDGHSVYNFSLYIDAGDADLNQIQSVKYTLPNGTATQEAIVTNAQDDFTYTNSGWGQFVVSAEIRLRNGQSVQLSKRLDFTTAGKQ